MRCKNCGWENPSGLSKCEKCNAPLNGSMAENNEAMSGSRNASDRDPLRATIPERDAFGFGGGRDTKPYNTEFTGQPDACSVCGYELASGMTVCPMCGTPTNGGKPRSHEASSSRTTLCCPKCSHPIPQGTRFCPQCGRSLRAGTVNPWESPQQDFFCTLKPIAWGREEVSYTPISYSGQTIVLNRSNTDPNNQSITSKEQAVLTYDGSSWYIENRSENESTMIRIRKKTKLEAGDIIALGNRLFEFKG